MSSKPIIFFTFFLPIIAGMIYNQPATPEQLKPLPDYVQVEAEEVKQEVIEQTPIEEPKAVVEQLTTEVKPLVLSVDTKHSNYDGLVQKTQKYIEKYFYPKQNSKPSCKKTLVTAKEWVDIAQANDFPLDFLIVQAHVESHGGTCGRAHKSNNVHNVNNTDRGDNMPVTICGVFTECLDNWLAGEQKFINLIKACYTKQGQQPSLADFINQDFRIQQTVKPYCSAKVGSRYMTDRNARAKYIDTYNKFKTIFNY